MLSSTGSKINGEQLVTERWIRRNGGSVRSEPRAESPVAILQNNDVIWGTKKIKLEGLERSKDTPPPLP